MKKFKKFILSFFTTIVIGVILYFNNPTILFDDIASNKHMSNIINENICLYYLNDDILTFDDEK